MAAEVGLLSRNIKIEGAAYAKQEGQSFGARIVVGQAVEGSNSYIGTSLKSLHPSILILVRP
jgi:hypothetical protein